MESGEKIEIFDTTLRDGQQCPGAGMAFEQNVAYAELAADVGVDVLEAGFPAASRVDFDITQEIATRLSKRIDSPIIAALTQLRREQVEKTIEALTPAARAQKARVHIYLPVSPDLMKASLGESAQDLSKLVEEVHTLTALAAASGMQVEFSPEGYSRMGENFGFATDVIRAALAGGATIINCPDTIGGACWLEGKRYFVETMKRHSEIMRREFPTVHVTWSVHCHNDFGLALHNSLNAVLNGPARQIEGCFNGVGERAGNVALEQCIMVLKHFGSTDENPQRFYTGVRTEKLQAISNFVSDWMLPCQPHWPISGVNAARHSSGGHTNAILRNPLAYQAFDPCEVGKEISFVFGPLSGGNHAQTIIQKFGYRCDEGEKSVIAQYIKDYYSTRRKGVTDEELLTAYFDYRKPIVVDEFDYGRRSSQSEITLKGRFFSEYGTIQDVYEGKNSALATLKQAIDKRFPGLSIVSYQSEGRGTGISATSVSTIVVMDGSGASYTGNGEDQDIEISAMKALIDGTNRAYVEQNFRVVPAAPTPELLKAVASSEMH